MSSSNYKWVTTLEKGKEILPGGRNRRQAEQPSGKEIAR